MLSSDRMGRCDRPKSLGTGATWTTASSRPRSSATEAPKRHASTESARRLVRATTGPVPRCPDSQVGRRDHDRAGSGAEQAPRNPAEAHDAFPVPPRGPLFEHVDREEDLPVASAAGLAQPRAEADRLGGERAEVDSDNPPHWPSLEALPAYQRSSEGRGWICRGKERSSSTTSSGVRCTSRAPRFSRT